MCACVCGWSYISHNWTGKQRLRTLQPRNAWKLSPVSVENPNKCRVGNINIRIACSDLIGPSHGLFVLGTVRLIDMNWPSTRSTFHQFVYYLCSICVLPSAAYFWLPSIPVSLSISLSLPLFFFCSINKSIPKHVRTAIAADPQILRANLFGQFAPRLWGVAVAPNALAHIREEIVTRWGPRSPAVRHIGDPTTCHQRYANKEIYIVYTRIYMHISSGISWHSATISHGSRTAICQSSCGDLDDPSSEIPPTSDNLSAAVIMSCV